MCEHCDRLSQTTCINVVNCKRVTKIMSSLFCGKESGIVQIDIQKSLVPLVAKIFYIGVGNSGFPTTYSIYYTTFVVLVSNFSSKKNSVVSLGFALALPNLHIIIPKNAFLVKFF